MMARSQLARDAMFWAAIMLAAVAGVGLFKTLVAALPGTPDGLNKLAAAL